MISKPLFDKYATDPSAFRADLLVDVSGNVKRFGDVMDPWQRADFKAIDPGLLKCIGRSQADAKMRFYRERARGHSKTSDLAAICVYAIAFATRPLKGFCYAADQDQARLLRDAMQTVIRLNPWLGDILEVQRMSVVNKAAGHPGEGGSLLIECSDVASSFGILPDILICDELVHWPAAGEGLWHSLISSSAKRENCVLCVITNAGFTDSWQWAVREAARMDENWHFSRLDGVQASWMNEKTLDEQRRMLPPIAYGRLWLNNWSTGGGDFLQESDIAASFVDDLTPMTGRSPSWLFVAGVDLGLVRDCSAVVVLAVPNGRPGKIRLAHHKLWRPTPGHKVDLREVELHLLELDERFGLENVSFDPWQAELLAARLDADSGHRRRNQQRRAWAEPWMREVQPTAANLRTIATLTAEYFNDHKLEMFPCEPLRRDLLKLRVEEQLNGTSFRLISPRDDHGHGDNFSAWSYALLVAHEIHGKRPVEVGTVDDVSEDYDARNPFNDTFLKEILDREGAHEIERELARASSDNTREMWSAFMKSIGRGRRSF